MDSAATIISRTNLDIHTFLTLANQLVGRTINEKVDRARNLPSPEAHFTSLLTAILNPEQTPSLSRSLSGHCSIGILAVCAADCLTEVVTYLSSLTHLVSPTVSRHHTLFIASGDLPTWKHAALAGLEESRSGCCREVFELIRQAFVAEGLDLWKDHKQKFDRNDQLYLTSH